MIDEDVLERGSRSLQDRALELQRARFGPVVTGSFTFNELVKGLPRGAIQKWLREACHVAPDGPAIYRIAAETQEGADALLDAFQKTKKAAPYKLPRLNHEHSGQTIYVGSSQKIADRLRQHLQRTAPGTHALQLRRWCPAKNHRLVIELQAPDNNVHTKMLQDVEDALWDQSRPLFGRRGEQ